MKIITDSHFIIGNSHTVCQDYATNVFLPELNTHVAIISDGCSSAKDSDIGSRIVSLAVLKTLQNGFNEVTFREMFLFHLKQFKDTLNIASELTATLMVAIVKDGKLNILAQGDGVIYLEYKNSNELYSISFSGNAPAYPYYSLDDNMCSLYENMDQSCSIFVNDDVSSTKATARDFTFNKTIENISELNRVVLFSDGIESFRKDNASIYIEDIYKSIIDFKNVNAGSFVLRKLNFLKKQWMKENITHEDDLSVAVIHFNEDENV